MENIRWWQRDKDGWPIEYVKGKGKTYRIIRCLVQNFRKILP